MHRSIITIRSNTRRPRARPDASLGYHSRLLLRKGCPPPRNSTWGCTTFIPTRGRPDLEQATSRAQYSSSILYGYFRPLAMESYTVLSRLDARNHSKILRHVLNDARTSLNATKKLSFYHNHVDFFAWIVSHRDRTKSYIRTVTAMQSLNVRVCKHIIFCYKVQEKFKISYKKFIILQLDLRLYFSNKVNFLNIINNWNMFQLLVSNKQSL